jgi:hypothetical protein
MANGQWPFCKRLTGSTVHVKLSFGKDITLFKGCLRHATCFVLYDHHQALKCSYDIVAEVSLCL